MNQYHTFVFDSYELDASSRTILLHYNLDGIIPFTETIRLPEEMPFDETHPDLDRALFALHLIGGISYYKTYLPPEIEVRSGTLTSAQASFWNDLYEKGLGEFFYKNDIDFRGLIRFPVTSDHFTIPSTPLSPLGGKGSGDRGRSKLLIPIGGGKDSTVTIELLKKAGYDITLLRVGKHALIDEAAKVAKLPLWNVGRNLSPALFTLNAEGALNGHVPITAYLHFLSVVMGLLSGRSYVAFSDESSADEGNIDFHGMQINHQWSKSIAFEQMFQSYISTYVTPSVACFSMLRPFSELKITELFCKYPQYFEHTTSCNVNWKILSTSSPTLNKEAPLAPLGGKGLGVRGRLMSEKERGWACLSGRQGLGGDKRWCGTCPKCAFVFAMLSAFLARKEVEAIFGGNLFADASLLPLYRELLGLEGFKPFECVGTPKETIAAFLLARKRDTWDDTVIMKMFIEEILPSVKNEEEMIQEVMRPSQEHCIPEAFQPLIKDL